MDLALNDRQKLVYHKTQTNKHCEILDVNLKVSVRNLKQKEEWSLIQEN